MKKSSFILTLLILSVSSFAAENLVLTCDGSLIGTIRIEGNEEKELSPIKTTESYNFKDGKLRKGSQIIKCDWSEEEIHCVDMSSRPHSINRGISINRITGNIDSMTSYLDGAGEFIRRDIFNGVCKETKRKF